EGIGGIINIITHKKSISGYNGTLNLTVSNPGGYTTGSNVGATIGKFGTSASYRYTNFNSPKSSSNLYRNDLLRETSLEQLTENSNISKAQYLNSELSYQPGPQHNLTANYSRNWNYSNTTYQ